MSSTASESKERPFGLYLILTDPLAGYAKCAEAAVAAKVRYLQLRMKGKTRDEILEQAHTLRSITAGSETIFIVNDDPEVAAAAQADGVHLGQEDMDIEEVRRRYPQLKIIGLSTHNRSQALKASEKKPAYIGVGPVFPTFAKAKPDPVLGCGEAARIISSVPLPATAIGGINAATLPLVLAAGAKNFAVVSAVCASPTPLEAIRQLQQIAARSAR